jgi:hypothetical protein
VNVLAVMVVIGLAEGGFLNPELVKLKDSIVDAVKLFANPIILNVSVVVEIVDVDVGVLTIKIQTRLGLLVEEQSIVYPP